LTEDTKPPKGGQGRPKGVPASTVLKTELRELDEVSEDADRIGV